MAPVTRKGMRVSVATIALGRTWRNMMIQSPTPIARAARTYSKLRARRNSARTTPTREVQLKSAISAVSSVKLMVNSAERMMMT